MAKSRLQEDCEKYSGLLEKGRVLAIDPSSGSAGSMPGYAYIEQSTLVESGTFQIKLGDIHTRLWSLSAGLRDSFRDIDVLIIEQLPPFMQSAGSTFKSRSVVNLHMSVGAVFAALGYAVTIGVSPSSWHADARKLKFDYEKTDENDALMLAYAVFSRADVEVAGLLNKLEASSEKARHHDVLPRKPKTRPGKRT